MALKDRLLAWRQRFREYRIAEREARRGARAVVDEADQDVTRAGLKKPPSGGWS